MVSAGQHRAHEAEGAKPRAQVENPMNEKTVWLRSDKEWEAVELGRVKWFPGEELTTELARLELTDVARVAAMLIGQRKTVEEATRGAYELFEAAAYCQQSLKLNNTYADGIEDYRRHVAKLERIRKRLDEMPRYEFKLDEKGKRLPVPLEEGLAVLWPMPGVSKAKAAETRIRRLGMCVNDTSLKANPDQPEPDRMKDLNAFIADLKREGIPPDTFDNWRATLPRWWRQKKRQINAAKGRTGQLAKKGKQGRVRSKKDKRIGARLPSG
jgi:hypothetical protein